MIKELGIVKSIERLVTKKQPTEGYKALAEMGLQDIAFEAVVCRHPESFSEEAVEAYKKRLEEWE